MGFSSVSDAELKRELRRYRGYVLSNLEKIRREINENSQKIAVMIESFAQRPEEKILKQLALYVDSVVISDPLFEMTERINDATKEMNKYLNMKNQERLRKNVKVHNLVKKDGEMYVKMEKKLVKGTGLWIEFPECNSMSGEFVQYCKSEIVKCDDVTREVLCKMSFPEEISQYEFDNWLEQSVNRACLQLYQDTYRKLLLASSMNTMYLTQSVLRAQLMAQETEPSIRSQITNMALKLEVPVLENSKIKILLAFVIIMEKVFKIFELSWEKNYYNYLG